MIITKKQRKIINILVFIATLALVLTSIIPFISILLRQ